MANPEDYNTDPKFIKLLYKSHIIIHNLFIKNNIVYYSSGGTTLGATRNRGIINHDDDIDLEISDKDVSRLMSPDFKKQLKKKGYYIRYHHEVNSKDKYDWLKIKSYFKVNNKRADIDLFPVIFDLDPDGRMRTYFSSKHVRKIWPKAFIYIDELLPLKQVDFGDGIMIVPNKAGKYLTRTYGKTWSKKAIITLDKDHNELDKPIILKSKDFKNNDKSSFYNSKNQIVLDDKDILLTLIGYGFLE
jgi:phosphorylcholine metabolism protein LicD